VDVDAIDRKILKILQQDATPTVAEVGRAVGLSTTPCWKRIQKLEASGIIKKRVAIVAREKVGFGVTVQVNIQSADHSPLAVDAFIEAVCAMPEVLEFQRVAGDADFSLRIVTVDIRHYEQVYQRLTALMPLRRVSSYFELQELKSETALPLGLAPGAATRPKPVEEDVSG
jgi:Lrp/AsnC family transcriptional regulator